MIFSPNSLFQIFKCFVCIAAAQPAACIPLLLMESFPKRKQGFETYPILFNNNQLWFYSNTRPIASITAVLFREFTDLIQADSCCGKFTTSLEKWLFLLPASCRVTNSNSYW